MIRQTVTAVAMCAGLVVGFILIADAAWAQAATQPEVEVLAFRIVYDIEKAGAEEKAEAERMLKQFRDNGPVGQAGNLLRWYEVPEPRDMQHTVKHGGKDWLLCHITPKRSMHYSGPGSKWKLTNVSRTRDERIGRFVVEMRLDETGAKLLGTLSENHLDQQLAIIIAGRVLAAPILKSRVDEKAWILGNWSAEEVDQMVQTLRQATE